MKKLYYSMVALLFVAAGCTKDDLAVDNPVAQEPVAKQQSYNTFNATLPSADTRMQLVNGDEVVWNEDERIIIFTDDYGDTYTLSAGAGTSQGVFKGSLATGDTFYAFAPGDIGFYDWDLNKKQYDFSWPYEVVWGNENLGEISHRIPMFAMSKDNNLQFKQLSGILHFSFKGTGTVNSVYLKGNNGERFYQSISVNYAGESPVTVPVESDNYKFEVFSSPATPIELTKDDIVDVYFFLPGGLTFKNGITLTVEVSKKDSEGYETYYQVVKSTENPITIEQAVSLDFDAIDLDEEFEANAKAQQDAMIAIYNALGGADNPFGWDITQPYSSWNGVRTTDGTNVWLLELNGTNWDGEFTIPAEIANLRLEQIVINNFKKLKAIENIGNVKTLWYVSLANDNLEGALPDFFANMPRLEYLNLSNNNFTGGFPDKWLSDFVTISNLVLDGNKLNGTISLDQQQSPMWQRLLWNWYGHRFWYPYADNQQEGYGIKVEGAVRFNLKNNYYPMAVGGTAQLDLEFIEGKMSDLTFNYDNKVVSVDENGTIKAFAIGETYIYIYSKNEPNYEIDRTIVRVQYAVNGANEDFTDDNETGGW